MKRRKNKGSNRTTQTHKRNNNTNLMHAALQDIERDIQRVINKSANDELSSYYEV